MKRWTVEHLNFTR